MRLPRHPSTRPIIAVLAGLRVRPNIVRLPVVVPRNDFNHLRREGQNLVPAAEPEQVAWEVPRLGREIGEEPGGHGRHVGFPTQPLRVLGVEVRGRDVGFRGRRSVRAVAVPPDPVECAVDVADRREVPDPRGGQIRHEVEICAGGGADILCVEELGGIVIAVEGGDEALPVDEELAWFPAVLGEFGADEGVLARLEVVVVEGDEDLHVVLGGAFVGEVELGVGVGVCGDVEGEGVDAGGFGALHVGVVVGGGLAVAHDADLGWLDFVGI